MTSATTTAPTSAETNQHYDQDPGIFGLFLDPLRKYSSGLYATPQTTLAQAQVAKLHYVAGRLEVTDGARLLDVGCGWGSLVLFMAREYRARVVGISPTGLAQHDYITSRVAELGLDDSVHIVTGAFEDSTIGQIPAGGFDGVSMLGSIVHMPDLGHAMRRARSLLRRGGRYYVSESCFRNAATRAAFDTGPGLDFIRESIFGWGDMRPLSDLVEGQPRTPGSPWSAWTTPTDDYRRTIEDWHANVAANADAIDAIRPGYAATLTQYLEVANAGWGYTTKHYALTCKKAR